MPFTPNEKFPNLHQALNKAAQAFLKVGELKKELSLAETVADQADDDLVAAIEKWPEEAVAMQQALQRILEKRGHHFFRFED